jgi:serine/threonine protein kinase
MELELGQVVGRYVLESKIGEGGMAVVYKAKHQTLGLPFALKFLKVSNESIRQRLIREGRLQASLRHPNVVGVTDVLMYQGSPCLVMEFIDGPSLDEWLVSNRPSLDETEFLFLQILDAVNEAHDNGFIHRDLKPSNIMLQSKKGILVPKVCDFGLAKAMEKDQIGYTRSGMTMGTPAYMAPEQVRNAKSTDSRADIFALGAILYEMVTGRKAFQGKDTLELFNAVATHPHIPTRKLVKSVADRIGMAIDGALVKDPDDRIPSCAVLREVLLGKRGWQAAVKKSVDTIYLDGIDYAVDQPGEDSPTMCETHISDGQGNKAPKREKARGTARSASLPPKQSQAISDSDLQPKGRQGIVTGHNLSLRAGPTVAADRIALLRRGTTVRVVAHFDAIEAQEGQLKDDYEFKPLKGESYTLPAGLAFAFTGENDTHYRAEFIAPTHTDIGYIPKSLVRDMSEERWYQIETENDIGWIISRYLRMY